MEFTCLISSPNSLGTGLNLIQASVIFSPKIIVQQIVSYVEAHVSIIYFGEIYEINFCTIANLLGGLYEGGGRGVGPSSLHQINQPTSQPARPTSQPANKLDDAPPDQTILA